MINDTSRTCVKNKLTLTLTSYKLQDTSTRIPHYALRITIKLPITTGWGHRHRHRHRASADGIGQGRYVGHTKIILSQPATGISVM
jgi:hypothetical protein